VSVRSRLARRDACAAVPGAHVRAFFEQLDAGARDALIGEYVALPAAGRTLAMTGTEPSLGDVAPNADAITDVELDRDLAATLPSRWARDHKDIVEIPGVGEIVNERRGCLPATKWLVVGGVVVALVIGGIVVALTGRDRKS